MANGWKEVCADFIISKLTGGKVKFGSKATYFNNYALIDFTSDDDIPNLRAVRALLGAYSGGIPVSFSAVDTFTIDWQTDIPPGFTFTYVEIFGNFYPKPMVFNNSDQKLDFGLTANRVTPGDITTDITTVVFDFGIATTGTIQF